MQTSYPGQGCKVLMKIWILNICCSVVMLPENGRLLCIWMIDDASLKHILAAHIKYSAEFQHSQHHHRPVQWCTWPIINKYIHNNVQWSHEQMQPSLSSDNWRDWWTHNNMMSCTAYQRNLKCLYLRFLYVYLIEFIFFSEFWKFRFSWDWDHFIFMRQHLTSHWETKILLSKYQGPRNSVK